MTAHTNFYDYYKNYNMPNTHSLEERFIPINDESNKSYPNFDIDNKYPGEWLIKENFAGFNNVTNVISKFLQTHNAKIESVNDYEIICKTENNYIQLGLKNIDYDTYYMIVGPVRQWLESIKNNSKEA